MATLDEARAVKAKVIELLKTEIPNAAVGIALPKRKSRSYGVAVRLQTKAKPGQIPEELDGVKIEVEVIGLAHFL